MKKTLYLLAIAALLCSCAAEPAETTTTTTTAAPAATTTTTEKPAQTTPEADRGERLQVNANAFYHANVDPADLYFYQNEATPLYESDNYHQFDYTYGFGTSVYDDSTLHPERFDLENYDYTPETEYTAPKLFEIRAGDTVGDYRIYSAHTTIARNSADDEERTIVATEIVLDGEYTFTGALRFFYDEEYTIESGDLQFIPTEPLTNFPLPLGFGAVPSFFLGNTAVYSELINGFRVGNLFTGETGMIIFTDEENNLFTPIKLGESVLAELNRMLSGEKSDCERRVEITLSNITLAYNDQNGSTRTKAVITGIKEIK